MNDPGASFQVALYNYREIGNSGLLGLPWWLSYKESACNAGDPGWIPGSGRSPGEGNGYPLQYSCLENPMDRGAWWAPQSMGAQSRTQLNAVCLYPFTDGDKAPQHMRC